MNVTLCDSVASVGEASSAENLQKVQKSGSLIHSLLLKGTRAPFVRVKSPHRFVEEQIDLLEFSPE